MALAPDDDVIVDGDAHVPSGLGDALGDLDVGAARLGRAGGVVVDKDHRGCPDVHRPADHLARVDRSLVDRAVADVVIVDQPVPGVEIEHPHPLDGEVGHVGGEVVDQRLPTAQHRLAHDLAARHAAGGGGDGLQCGRGVLAHALDPLQGPRIGVHHPGKAAELGEQGLGERLGIAARDGGEQEVFKHLVIGQRLRTAGQEPVAQARAVTFTGSLARVPIGRGPVEEIETVFSFRQGDLRESMAPDCFIAFGR